MYGTINGHTVKPTYQGTREPRQVLGPSRLHQLASVHAYRPIESPVQLRLPRHIHRPATSRLSRRTSPARRRLRHPRARHRHRQWCPHMLIGAITARRTTVYATIPICKGGVPAEWHHMLVCIHRYVTVYHRRADHDTAAPANRGVGRGFDARRVITAMDTHQQPVTPSLSDVYECRCTHTGPVQYTTPHLQHPAEIQQLASVQRAADRCSDMVEMRAVVVGGGR